MAPESDDDNGRSEHETEDDPDDDIIDDLQALDSSRLRDTLSEELVQWNRQPQRKKSVSSHRTQSQSDDFDDLLEFGDRSAQSENDPENDHFQGEKEELDDYDEISGDEASLERPVRTLKSKETKRVKARQAEIPKWGHKAVDSRYRDQTKKAAVAMGFLNENDGLKDFKDDDDAWPDAPWCPPGPGQRIMSLFAQPQMLRLILQHAIRQITGHAMTKSAYIPVEETPTHIISTTKQSARHFASKQYEARLEKDVMLKVEVVRVMNNRLSIYRAKSKSVARDLIELKYFLNDDDDRKTQIDKLIKNSIYIYPLKPDGSGIINTKPFHHPAIIRTITEMYFTARRGRTLAEKHATRFTSSITEGARANELEVPAPMVAMAATAIHASFDDFASKRDFSADVYEDVYRKHISFLDDLRNMGIGKYHKIMAGLYTVVSSNSAQVAKASNDAMHVLNFDDMSE
ncbi:hypothetical protein JOM56_014919 [Amanita muscaria]